MEQVPSETRAAFERWLDRAGVAAPQRPECHNWVRFYLDFCHKYGHAPGAPRSLEPYRGGGSVAPGRHARPETTPDLLALTEKLGFEFGIAPQQGHGTGLAREWLASGKPVVGLIHLATTIILHHQRQLKVTSDAG